MLRLSLTLKNPFTNNVNFRSFFSLGGKVYDHKYWEIQSVRDVSTLFELELDLNFSGRDHAGPSLTIGVFGHYILLKVYDNRHWDYSKNRWLND